jgi:HlyD family secretion protein
MAKQRSIFRQASLDRLASPDQLDQLVQVTSPTGWLALSGCGLLIAAALVWSVQGELPTNVVGNCIFMKSGGIKEVTFTAGGRVTDLAVREGDIIEQGQIIARVQQVELLSTLRNLQQDREDLIVKIQTNIDVMDSQGRSLESQMAALKNRIENREELLRDGLITRQSVEEDRNRLQSLRTEEKQLPLRKTEQSNQLNQLDRSIASLIKRLDEATAVYSSYSGRVVELMVSAGQLVGPGTKLLNLEPSGLNIKNLEALIYVPAGPGKQVKRGMSVKLAPATVKREEFGNLLGTVTSVSAFPSTQNGMMSILQNQELVSMLSSSSSTIQIVADLIPDTSNFSGYRWTSPAGPPVKIEPGTVCAARITIRTQAPITLVIPAIKKFIGVY